jgi:CheY-like chemotaxis protein
LAPLNVAVAVENARLAQFYQTPMACCHGKACNCCCGSGLQSRLGRDRGNADGCGTRPQVGDLISYELLLTTGGLEMSKKYVLIVDDDPDMVETVGMMLESKGYEVGKAYDGIEGDESIKNRRPDLLVLDVMMPRKDGYTLCAELKNNDATRDIPVILLTAVGEAVPTTTYSHADGMATEADDYIPKPVDTNTLVHSIERLFS